jgi:hypothetical protein
MLINHTLRESSGQFRLRIPRDLHAALVREAGAQGVSLNSYVMYLLSTRHSQEIAWQDATEFYARRLEATVREVHDRVISMTIGEPEPAGFSWRSTGASSIVTQ